VRRRGRLVLTGQKQDAAPRHERMSADVQRVGQRRELNGVRARTQGFVDRSSVRGKLCFDGQAGNAGHDVALAQAGTALLCPSLGFGMAAL